MTRFFRVVSMLMLITLIGGCERTPVDHAALRALVGNEPVVLLSASWCGYCRKLRSDLVEWRVPFRELDVETNMAGESAYRLLNARSIPLLLVNEQIQRGYSRNETQRLLQRAGLLPKT
ncbi:MAG: glutaredoxin domain-containing protein [Dokdonella sp.]